MKKKQIEKLQPVKTRKKGHVLTVQFAGSIIVLNVFKDGNFEGRQCINSFTGEYQQFNAKDSTWSRKKLYNLLEIGAYDYYFNPISKSDANFDSKDDELKVAELLKKHSYYPPNDTLQLIDRTESLYNSVRRQTAEENRIDRINQLMGRIEQTGQLPCNIDKWLFEAAGDKDFSFYDKAAKKYSCTACGSFFDESLAVRADGETKVRHNDLIICPACGKNLKVKRRTNKQIRTISFALLQNIDEEISVYRSFDAVMFWHCNSKKIKLSEAVRIILYKTGKKAGKISEYNGTYSFGYADSEITDPRSMIVERQKFDNAHNYGYREIRARRLYPAGIQEALKGTHIEGISHLIAQAAAEKHMLEYHRIICCQQQACKNAFEYFYKGRFYRLLADFVGDISLYSREYEGFLDILGRKSINEVLKISDTQKIHRLRDINGGELELSWLKWSDSNGMGVSDRFLKWAADHDIYPGSINSLLRHMSPEKSMNYITRQQSEDYFGKTAREVIIQYDDYMSMCVRLGKNTDDEMIYKPRELKRRHDEAVLAVERERMLEDIKKNKKQRETEAENMRKKFPGCEEILKAVRSKYEYSNDEYIMTVPQSLMEIIQEGAALHHCVGSSDRYFDRIRNNETYICFLRKADDPEVPFYTIEFEPGGTIRQHRSLFDEEPGIEHIRGFLKEWQREIRKRLKKKDYELAEISAVKRIENIQELERKRNTRVLAALEEDFMEAM